MPKAPPKNQPLGVLRTALALALPALLGILVLLLLSPLSKRHARNTSIRLVTGCALPLAGLSVRCEDPAGLLGTRPAIVVINHESAIDPLVAGALLRTDVVPVVKASLRTQFPIGWLLGLAGAVFVHRDAGEGSAALRPALRALGDNNAVVIAPQGTRQAHVSPGSFRPGAVALARQSGVPVILLHICDAGQHMGSNHWQLRPGVIHTRVLGMQSAAEVTLASLEQAYLNARQTPGTDT